MAVSRPQLWSLIGLAISIPSAWRAATSLWRMAWAPLIMAASFLWPGLLEGTVKAVDVLIP